MTKKDPYYSNQVKKGREVFLLIPRTIRNQLFRDALRSLPMMGDNTTLSYLGRISQKISETPSGRYCTKRILKIVAVGKLVEYRHSLVAATLDQAKKKKYLICTDQQDFQLTALGGDYLDRCDQAMDRVSGYLLSRFKDDIA